MMILLPADIEAKINLLFIDLKERETVKQLMSDLWSKPLNVGPDQLTRSILILSEGRISEVEKIFHSNFYDDPRDVIMMAEQKSGNPGHYFVDRF
jgi:hypothetical protein